MRSDLPPGPAAAVSTEPSYDGPQYPFGVLAFLGPWDVVIIVAVIAFVFGTKPFARTLRSLKSGGRELKRELRGEDERRPPTS